MTTFTLEVPHTCPRCGEVTDEVNLSVNVSNRHKDGYTGDTAYGDKLPAIGATCRDCDIEWIDAPKAQEALAELLLVKEN